MGITCTSAAGAGCAFAAEADCDFVVDVDCVIVLGVGLHVFLPLTALSLGVQGNVHRPPPVRTRRTPGGWIALISISSIISKSRAIDP